MLITKNFQLCWKVRTLLEVKWYYILIKIYKYLNVYSTTSKNIDISTFYKRKYNEMNTTEKELTFFLSVISTAVSTKYTLDNKTRVIY